MPLRVVAARSVPARADLVTTLVSTEAFEFRARSGRSFRRRCPGVRGRGRHDSARRQHGPTHAARRRRWHRRDPRRSPHGRRGHGPSRPASEARGRRCVVSRRGEASSLRRGGAARRLQLRRPPIRAETLRAHQGVGRGTHQADHRPGDGHCRRRELGSRSGQPAGRVADPRSLRRPSGRARRREAG